MNFPEPPSERRHHMAVDTYPRHDCSLFTTSAVIGSKLATQSIQTLPPPILRRRLRARRHCHAVPAPSTSASRMLLLGAAPRVSVVARRCAFAGLAPVVRLPSTFVSISPSRIHPRRPQLQCAPRVRVFRVQSDATAADPLGLPPALRKTVDLLAVVPDPKMRYQQLLFLAKDLPPMSPSLKTDNNRVYGCTSVVHVHVQVEDSGRVRVQGDSDSQLTKGLLALLISGLRDASSQQILDVDPSFIQYSGLAVALTPARNNGFASMLAKIKSLVSEQSSDAPTEQASSASVDQRAELQTLDTENDNLPKLDPSRPVYSAIATKLRALKPTSLQIIDDSAAHAGHGGSKGLNGESHFHVRIVSPVFESVSVVNRHRLIYTLLSDEMSAGHIHALQIDARTPDEL